jgi:hypothetical protein
VDGLAHLLQEAGQACELAKHLQTHVRELRAQAAERQLFEVNFALSLCLADAESAATRLSGLRNELRDLLSVARTTG